MRMELTLTFMPTGVLGTAQLAAFKPVWTNNFSDALLFLVGFGIVGFSQILVVNWTPVSLLHHLHVSLPRTMSPHVASR